MAVLRTVRPGCEAAFEEALRGFLLRARGVPGEAGVSVLRPPPGGREYGILRRFTDEGSLRAFYDSPLFLDWEAEVAPLCEGPARREQVSGLEAWFTAPGRPMFPPPRWKRAATTLLGVYPVSLALQALLRPLLEAWPRWAGGLVFAAAMVACLTWGVMPVLVRLLHPWLHPARSSPP